MNGIIIIESERPIMNTISLRSEEERAKNDIIRDMRATMTIPPNRIGSMDSEDDADLTASTSFVPVDLDRAQANLLMDRAINLSWVVNLLLLIAKIYVGVVSNSKSMWASLADSFVDLLSQVVLSLAAKYSRKHNPDYPVGRSRLEALSVLACAFIMIMASMEVVQFSINDLVNGFNGEIPELYLQTIMIVIISLGIFGKLVLHIYCRFANKTSNSDALAALAEDHMNDVVSNSVALATAFIAVYSKGGWWVDPVGAIVISIAIIYRWIFVMRYMLTEK
jgi:cation diffusion facilitator family transporter